MTIFDIHEGARLATNRQRTRHWNRWGPYLAERAWGTVREDYSADGEAWGHFPHDHARSRTYRWNDDGLGGICDFGQYLGFALSLWNGRDPILKERMFGLTGAEGNHGEDVKEYCFHLDSTPTHSYMPFLYKYPQAEFPYARLVEENRLHDPINSLWDEEEHEPMAPRARTMVGVVPMFGASTLPADTFERYPDFNKRRNWFTRHGPDLVDSVGPMIVPGPDDDLILGLVRPDQLRRMLARVFQPDENGRRAVFGSCELFNTDPNWRDLIPFHEYFHGDTGRGCGASHQTGWMGLMAQVLINPVEDAAAGEDPPVPEM